MSETLNSSLSQGRHPEIIVIGLASSWFCEVVLALAKEGQVVIEHHQVVELRSTDP